MKLKKSCEMSVAIFATLTSLALNAGIWDGIKEIGKGVTEVASGVANTAVGAVTSTVHSVEANFQKKDQTTVPAISADEGNNVKSAEKKVPSEGVNSISLVDNEKKTVANEIVREREDKVGASKDRQNDDVQQGGSVHKMLNNNSREGGIPEEVKRAFYKQLEDEFLFVDKMQRLRDGLKLNSDQGNVKVDLFERLYVSPHGGRILVEDVDVSITSNKYFKYIVNKPPERKAYIVCPRTEQDLQTWTKKLLDKRRAYQANGSLVAEYNDFMSHEFLPRLKKCKFLSSVRGECYYNTLWKEDGTGLASVAEKLGHWNNSGELIDLSSRKGVATVYNIGSVGNQENEDKIRMWIVSTRKWFENVDPVLYAYTNSLRRAKMFVEQTHKSAANGGMEAASYKMKIYKGLKIGMTPEEVYDSLKKEKDVEFKGWDFSDVRNNKRFAEVMDGMSFVVKLEKHTLHLLFGASENSGRSVLIATRIYFNDVANSPTADQVGARYEKMEGVKVEKKREVCGYTWKKDALPFWRLLYETSTAQIMLYEQNGSGDFGPLKPEEKVGMGKLKKDLEKIQKDFGDPVYVESTTYKSGGMKVTVYSDSKTGNALNIDIDDEVVKEAMRKLKPQLQKEKEAATQQKEKAQQDKKKEAALQF